MPGGAVTLPIRVLSDWLIEVQRLAGMIG